MVWRFCSESGLYPDLSGFSAASFPSSLYGADWKNLPRSLCRKYPYLEKNRNKRAFPSKHPYGLLVAAFSSAGTPSHRFFCSYRKESSENSVYAFLLWKDSGNRLYRCNGLGSALYSFSGIYGCSCRRLYFFCGRKSSLLSSCRLSSHAEYRKSQSLPVRKACCPPKLFPTSFQENSRP